MQATVTVLHTHVLVVILFLILFSVKAIMLFLNKHKLLDKTKRYTKALDMVFGTLILITGAYLIYLYKGWPSWLVVKMLLVLLAIPLGIVGIKRHNKMLTLLSLLIFIYIYAVAETKSLSLRLSQSHSKPAAHMDHSPHTDAAEANTPEADEHTAEVKEEIISDLSEAQLANAKAIYTQICATCHGPDGAKGLAGAANLIVSNLSLQDRINVIENGRGLMPGFGQQLTEQEAEALAAYTMTLKK